MDPQHLSRLQEEQAKAVRDTEHQIKQMEEYKSDYKTLKERLRTLPDELTHDVMVPFGKFAFMPGKLVHTNEILVLLGDNWFVEQSAKQAEEIAQRRIEELNKQLNKLCAQKKLLEPRLEFTSDFQNHIKGQTGVKEIVEEYDAEKERLWDEQHKKNVRKQREAARVTQETYQPDKMETKNQNCDSDLWARLDALEKEETERRELERGDSDKEENEMDKMSLAREDRLQYETPLDRYRSKSDSDDDDDDNDGVGTEDASDDVEEDSDCYSTSDECEFAVGKDSKRPVVKTIRFTHTDTPSYQTTKSSYDEDKTIQSPADIYKLYSPASILKKTGPSQRGKLNQKKGSVKVDTEQAPSKSVGFSSDGDFRPQTKLPCAADPPRTVPTSSLKAFSGTVLETSQDEQSMVMGPKPDGNHNVNPTEEPPKRMSKFKASRMAKQGFS
ncbi:hypothetical protein EGW08_002029 [Elysia chlorotica]|uniref:Protein phosphatase 1 regulatory subunit 19 n=1 Tax=Elysia chlorotica TaxID=188477 RepID=A0A3S1BKE9_ELYCH|nr:hypothetical protein EGW08_002029 [Elysia chlorotica]